MDVKANRQFYLGELTPQIVDADGSAPQSVGLTSEEADVVRHLRSALTVEQWHSLPALVDERLDTSPAYRAALADRNRARARAAQQAAAAEALKAEEKRRAEQALALESARARDYEAFEMSFLDAERHVDPDDMDLVARAGYLE
ncbi:MAG: hypothetical protein M3P40_12490, partial [Actinomycetota bacterium]|nr:hypothetical protein [Actinomycetota bacterium]